MNQKELWLVVEDQRRRLADFLGTLEADEWTQPSLCRGWTVKDVVAHIAIVPFAPSLWRMFPTILRAGGSLDRVNHDIACTFGSGRTTGQLIDLLRNTADSRKLPSVTSVDNLAMDIVAHGQDIAIPLGRTLPVPPDAALNALQRAWTMGWPFHARRRLAGYRLIATDAPWAAGNGPPLRGTCVNLLLVVTGRQVRMIPDLDGPALSLLATGQVGVD